MRIKLVSWNVNGLRALSAKPEWEWFTRTDAQIVALQETKAHPEQLKEELASPEGWEAHWSSSHVKKLDRIRLMLSIVTLLDFFSA